MTFAITAILVFIYFNIGGCKATCDSIEFHDAYKHRTRFWQQDSWKDRKNIFGFVFNGWHFFDIMRTTLSLIALAICVIFRPEPNWYMLAIPVSHYLGFKAFYR